MHRKSAAPEGRSAAVGLVFAGALTAALAGAVGCDGAADGESEKGAPLRQTNVAVALVRPDSMVQHSVLPVTALPWQQATLAFQEPGAVAAVLVDLDDAVSAGQELAHLDDDLIRAAVSEAEAGLALQRYRHERTGQLHAEGSVAERELRQVAYELQRATALLATARKRAANTVLRAPFGGAIAARWIETGESVQPGTPAFELVRVDSVKALAWVAERRIGEFAVGDRVNVQFDALPDTDFDAAVSRIGPAADPERRVFPVQVYLDNPAGGIRAGMIGRVRVVRRTLTDVAVVPREAVHGQPGQTTVFVANAGTARVRPVTLGPEADNRVVVTSGLQFGDTVVVAGGRDLIDGDRIRVTEGGGGP